MKWKSVLLSGATRNSMSAYWMNGAGVGDHTWHGSGLERPGGCPGKCAAW